MNILVVIQLAIAFVIGLTSLLLVHRILNVFLNRRFQLSDNINTAYGVFQAGIFLSTAVILKSVINPAVNALRLFSQSGLTASDLMTSALFIITFIVIGVVMTLLVIGVTTIIIFQITHVNEWEEIKNNNIGIAIISSAIVLGLSWLLAEYVGHFCEAILPYPSVLSIY